MSFKITYTSCLKIYEPYSYVLCLENSDQKNLLENSLCLENLSKFDYFYSNILTPLIITSQIF